AKDVTEKRLYLEAMSEILPKLGKKYVIDSGQTNLLPLLNMGEAAGQSPTTVSAVKDLLKGDEVLK
ncbi:MAG: hypothetical protein HQK73_06555, partial [Desulfamplus sp.]|nr:hypothetical protein [Desulfamplus sp.]